MTSRMQLHFLIPSYAPFFSESSKLFQQNTVQDLTTSYFKHFLPLVNPSHFHHRLFDRKHALVAVDPRFGKYLTAAVIFRGNVGSKDVCYDLISRCTWY
jgi:tubulin beta